MPRVSLIVPIYNVERYLFEALRSVQAQTMRDFEVVLVDDGSTDASPELAARFCEDDDRFVLVQQPNRGPGPGGGRNGGLDTAGGDLVMFMDSDDVIRPTTFAELTELLDNPALDMATTSAQRMSGVVLKGSSIHDIAHPVAEAATTIDASPWLMFDSTPWNKMFRREFFDTVVGRWPEQQLYEDILPMTECHLRARAVGVLTTPHYLWRSRSDGSSITQQRRGVDADLAQLEQLTAADQLVRAHGTEQLKLWLDWKAYTFDFVWMIRKLGLLSHRHAARLVVGLRSAMQSIGTAGLPTLGSPLRECAEAVLAGKVRRVQRLSVTHRLAIVPDRRRYDAAAVEPFLNGVVVSCTPHAGGQRLVTASPVEHGQPALSLSTLAPWVAPPGGGSESRTIAPIELSAGRRQIKATFEIQPEHVGIVGRGNRCYVSLSTPTARSELRRSVEDRVRGRTADGMAASPIRRFFEDSMLIFLATTESPILESVMVDDDHAALSGRIPPDLRTVAGELELRMTNGSGTDDHRYPITLNDNIFKVDVPVQHLLPGIDYFLAFINSNNPGLPMAVNVAQSTLASRGPGPQIHVRSSADGIASIRCNGNVLRSFLREASARNPLRR